MIAQPSTGGFDDGGGRLSVRVVPGPGHVVVAVTGEIDLLTERALRDALIEQAAEPVRRLVVDLAGLTYTSTAGFYVLLTVSDLVKMAGGTLVIARAARSGADAVTDGCR